MGYFGKHAETRPVFSGGGMMWDLNGTAMPAPYPYYIAVGVASPYLKAKLVGCGGCANLTTAYKSCKNEAKVGGKPWVIDEMEFDPEENLNQTNEKVWNQISNLKNYTVLLKIFLSTPKIDF